MSRAESELKLRFQGDLKQRLTEEAAKHSRSLNSEIVARLEASLRPAGDSFNSVESAPDLRGLIVEMHGMLKAFAQAAGPSTQSSAQFSTLDLLPPIGTGSKRYFRPRTPKPPQK